MENNSKNNKIWLISIIVISVLFLGYFLKYGEIVETNETNQEYTYITKYTWNKNDIQKFYNTYYVDRGYEDKPIEMQYVLLRCETKNGDLEAGTYHFETDETIGANFIVYIVNEPIDLNTYDGNEYEQIGNDYIRALHKRFRN